MSEIVPTEESQPRWDGGRIAVLTDFLSDFAGTERYTMTVCQALAARGVTLDVFVAEPPRSSTWVDLLAAQGIAVHAPASQSETADLWGSLNRHVATAKPDLVFVNPIGTAFVQWLSATSPRLAIPPIVGVEYSLPSRHSAHWYPTAVPALVHRLAGIITTCEASRSGVIDYFKYRGPTHVVPHLIDPPDQTIPVTTPRHHLGIVSRLSVEKGIDYALAAVALLEREGLSLELSVYGAGIDADRLRELATCLGIGSSMHLAGTFHPADALDETLARHAIWLQPSLFESVPTSLLELAARGRIVIASRVGGIPELFAAVPEAENLLVAPADTRALADCIRMVVTNAVRFDGISRALQQEVLARHAPDAVVSQLLDVLRFYGTSGPSRPKESQYPLHRRVDEVTL